MRRRLAALAIALSAVACASADTHYVVLTIDDPDGSAAGADQLLITDDVALSRTFDRGDRPFPMTVTLSSESSSTRALSVSALAAGTAVASCAVTIDFLRQDGGRSRCDLAASADCDLKGTCPPPPSGVPRLISLSPPAVILTGSTAVSITGVDFATAAFGTLDGVTQTRTAVTGTTLTISVAPSTAGYSAIRAANDPGDGFSNIAWLIVASAPVFFIEELNPDYGLPGDTIRVLGPNTNAGTFTLSDLAAHLVTCTPMPSPPPWPGPFGSSSQSCVLPSGLQEGVLLAENDYGVVRTRPFTVGANMSRLLGASAAASSTSNSYSVDAIADGDLSTSWYAGGETCGAHEACAWVGIGFGTTAISVRRVGIRGLRDSFAGSGYDILIARIELLDAGDVALDTRIVWTDRPHGDANADFSPPVDNVHRVRVTSLEAQTANPGLGELEIFGTPTP